MRALLLLLVFLNIAFFAYTRLVARSAEEHAAAVAAADAQVPRLRLASEVPPPAAPGCARIGPFAAEDAAERALAALGAPGAAHVQSVEEPAAASFVVRLSTRTQAEAMRVAVRLRAAGVKDFEVVPTTAANGPGLLAFGRFAERDAAMRRLASLGRYAINPVVFEEAAKARTFWIDVPLAPGAAPPDLAPLAAAAGEGAAPAVTTCPGFAPLPVPAPPAAAPAPDTVAPPTSPAPTGPPADGTPPVKSANAALWDSARR
jgi:hypothetical protein